jgi:hypothetical protein
VGLEADDVADAQLPSGAFTDIAPVLSQQTWKASLRDPDGRPSGVASTTWEWCQISNLRRDLHACHANLAGQGRG